MSLSYTALAQIQSEGAAAADGAFRAERNGQQIRRLFSEVETEAAGLLSEAAVHAGIALFKNARQVLRRDADACVRHGKDAVLKRDRDRSRGRILDGVG